MAVADLISQGWLNMKLSVQLESPMRDMESATYCTLFLPRRSDIVKEMQDAGKLYNEFATKHPDVERFFNAMRKIIGKTLTSKNENGGLSLPDQVNTEATRMIRTNTENTKFIELNTWIKACRHLPTYEKLLQPLRWRIIFAVEGVISHKWKKEADGDQRGPPFTRRSTDSAGRIQQEGDKGMPCISVEQTSSWGELNAEILHVQVMKIIPSDKQCTTEPSDFERACRAGEGGSSGLSPATDRLEAY